MLVALAAEWLNELARTHWYRFAGKPYFDRGGAFISVILSLPIILNGIVILVRIAASAHGPSVLTRPACTPLIARCSLCGCCAWPSWRLGQRPRSFVADSRPPPARRT